eukprot:CAMPEP_0204540238 /NCGR_PEP_ID=MMETSP0661-20131031/17337_1 /ASSEMBLY_ACC=CAM_ASM_000606 /TAXON_ID=109239 /ORGANISM="Alexandrium margalefi, Strain AMGDE01CS-322" /LENGTH=149 /DNA_ID=CAMNT_0051546887 /DNA_START=29 /DNA_END=475 /DNA_ORIENTATION=+
MSSQTWYGSLASAACAACAAAAGARAAAAGSWPGGGASALAVSPEEVLEGRERVAGPEVARERPPRQPLPARQQPVELPGLELPGVGLGAEAREDRALRLGLLAQEAAQDTCSYLSSAASIFLSVLVSGGAFGVLCCRTSASALGGPSR